MAVLQITADDLAAAESYGNVRQWGCVVATGWQEAGRALVPSFQFANGKRITLLDLSDGPERWRRMYQR